MLKKHEIQCRDMSILSVLSDTFLVSRFRQKNKKSMLGNIVFHHEPKATDSDLDLRNYYMVCERKILECRAVIKFFTFFVQSEITRREKKLNFVSTSRPSVENCRQLKTHSNLIAWLFWGNMSFKTQDL